MARRKRLRDFLFEHLESGDVEGLVWEDRASQTFRIPWRHANRRGNNYNRERDTRLARLWAINTMKFDPGAKQRENPTRWKTNLRCSLNSLKHSIVRLEIREDIGYHRFQFAAAKPRPKVTRDESKSASEATTATASSCGAESSGGTSLSSHGPALFQQDEEDPLQTVYEGGGDGDAFMSSISGMSHIVCTTASAYQTDAALSRLVAGAGSELDAVGNLGLDLTAFSTTTVPTSGGQAPDSQALGNVASGESVGFSLLDALVTTTSATYPVDFPSIPAARMFPARTNAQSNASLGQPRGELQSPTQPSVAFQGHATSYPGRHEMHVQVAYRGYAVAGCNVNSQDGCHLYYSSDGDTDLMSSGPSLGSPVSGMPDTRSSAVPSRQQLCLPRPGQSRPRFNGPVLHHVLEEFAHGLQLEVLGNELFATRRCATTVHFSQSQACHSARSQLGGLGTSAGHATTATTATSSSDGHMATGSGGHGFAASLECWHELEVRRQTCVFDFGTFRQALDQHNMGPGTYRRPSCRVYLVIGEPRSVGKDFSDHPLTIQVTVSRAEAMLEEVVTRSSAYSSSVSGVTSPVAAPC